MSSTDVLSYHRVGTNYTSTADAHAWHYCGIPAKPYVVTDNDLLFPECRAWLYFVLIAVDYYLTCRTRSFRLSSLLAENVVFVRVDERDRHYGRRPTASSASHPFSAPGSRSSRAIPVATVERGVDRSGPTATITASAATYHQ